MNKKKPKYNQRREIDISTAEDKGYAKSYIKNLLVSQPFGVLSTVASEQPFNSLVAFSNDDNMKYIFFATPKKTRKFKTILSNKSVSLLIDNRPDQLENINEISIVTANGCAEVLEGEERVTATENIVDKHPNLDEFLNAETTGIIKIVVEKYYCIKNFQEVFEWTP